MFPTDFEQSNHVFDKPEDMTRDQCEPLNTGVYRDTDGNQLIISCWKPTKEELEEIQNTGKVWCIHWGTYLQPHALTGHNPFDGN